MRYLLDTNIIIGFLRNDPVIVSRLEAMSQIVISIISVGEMLYGAETSLQKDKNISLYESFFKACTVLPVDSPVAREYARMRSTLKKMGRPIPENDVWIAATTKAHQTTLVTLIG